MAGVGGREIERLGSLPKVAHNPGKAIHTVFDCVSRPERVDYSPSRLPYSVAS